jgi:hypothetical protein
MAYDSARVQVRKDRVTGEWVVFPQRVQFVPIRVKTFPNAMVIADAYAVEIHYLTA